MASELDWRVVHNITRHTDDLSGIDPEACWREFADSFCRAYDLMNETSPTLPATVSIDDALVMGSLEYVMADRVRVKRGILLTKLHLGMADLYVHRLQMHWPHQQKALGSLATAVREFIVMCDLADMVSATLESNAKGERQYTLRRLRYLLSKVRRHAIRSDRCLFDGLSRLGRPLGDVVPVPPPRQSIFSRVATIFARG